MEGGRVVDTRLVPGGSGSGRFLEDIALCFVTCFLVLRVFEVVVFCYLGSYSFVVRFIRIYNTTSMMSHRENITLTIRGGKHPRHT